MATSMGVVAVRTAGAVGVVLAAFRRLVIVIMTAALRDIIVDVGMIERQHAATEPGDHAEHQEP